MQRVSSLLVVAVVVCTSSAAAGRLPDAADDTAQLVTALSGSDSVSDMDTGTLIRPANIENKSMVELVPLDVGLSVVAEPPSGNCDRKLLL